MKEAAQKLASALKASLKSMDQLFDTAFLEADQAIEAQAATALKAALQSGAGGAGAGSSQHARTAALACSLQTWQQRRDELLPRVRSALQAALVQRLEPPPQSPGGANWAAAVAAAAVGPGTSAAAVPVQQRKRQRGLPVVALQREVSMGGCFLCCNPRCTQTELLVLGERARRCKGCLVACYCW